VLLSGSCSTTTLTQVQFVKGKVRSFQIDPFRLIEDPGELDRIKDWAACQIQANLRREAAAGIVEYEFERIAAAPAGEGVRTLVVAGGEKSGAVMQGVGIRTLTFGEELDPGVPWAYSLDPEGFTFALKSGNFGAPDFFDRVLSP
jgi:3-dehydrotetronate 4-kinase